MRRILITGVSSGIGEATAKLFLSKGYLVLGIGRNATKDLLQIENFSFLQCDFDDFDETIIFDRVVEKLGAPPEIIINNSGAVTDTKYFKELTRQELAKALDINFMGALLILARFLPELERANFGRVVNVSSNTIKHRGNIQNFSYYLSKSCVDVIAPYIAKHYSDKNITCNTVRPGLIDSGMAERTPGYSREKFEARSKLVPCGRAGTVAEVAELIVFLSADDSGYINGQTIAIAGGE